MRNRHSMVQNMIAVLAIVCLVASTSFGDGKEDVKAKEQPAKKPAVKKGEPKSSNSRVTAGFSGFSMATLVSLQPIQTELKLTESQIADTQKIAKEHNAKSRELYQAIRTIKAKEERRKAYKETYEKRKAITKETDEKMNNVLNDAQKKRLSQIKLQRAGVRAITQKRVIKELEITEEQQTKIKAVFGSQKEKIQAIFKEMKEGNIERSDISEKFKEMRASTATNVTNVLTETQQKKLKEMKGEKFEWKRMQFNRKPNMKNIKIKKIQIGKQNPAQALPIKVRIQAQPKKIEK